MDKTLRKDEIQAIIEECEGVTPRPYVCGAKYASRRLEGGGYTTVAQFGDGQYDSVGWYANADYIARLDPATVKALCELALLALKDA